MPFIAARKTNLLMSCDLSAGWLCGSSKLTEKVDLYLYCSHKSYWFGLKLSQYINRSDSSSTPIWPINISAASFLQLLPCIQLLPLAVPLFAASCISSWWQLSFSCIDGIIFPICIRVSDDSTLSGHSLCGVTLKYLSTVFAKPQFSSVAC